MPGVIQYGIPTRDAGVVMSWVHPELRARLRVSFQDPAIRGQGRVSSGARTLATQIYLRKRYGSPRAANPYYRGADGRQGSAHQVQSGTAAGGSYKVGNVPNVNSFGYAVDSSGWSGGATYYAAQLKVFNANGLLVPLFYSKSNREPWHTTLAPNHTLLNVCGVRSKGSVPKDIQTRLGKLGYDVGTPDGVYGPRTAKAAEAFQKANGLFVHGDFDVVDLRKLEVVEGAAPAAPAKPASSFRLVLPERPSFGDFELPPFETIRRGKRSPWVLLIHNALYVTGWVNTLSASPVFAGDTYEAALDFKMEMGRKGRGFTESDLDELLALVAAAADK